MKFLVSERKRERERGKERKRKTRRGSLSPDTRKRAYICAKSARANLHGIDIGASQSGKYEERLINIPVLPGITLFATLTNIEMA
jgi:hypothetical protein